MSFILPENFPNPVTGETLPEADACAPLLRVAVLNIMPDKRRTEADILRALASDRFNIEITFIALETHTPSEKSAEHINKYYTPFSKIRQSVFDALVITGAPLEMYPYEDVRYYREFLEIVRWATEGGASARMYICWAAFALAYARYGINKHFLTSKLSGCYTHVTAAPHPVMEGIDAEFMTPHSRNIFIDARDICSCPELIPLAWSKDAGIHVTYDSAHNDFLVFGHWEYAPDTLKMEYERDAARGLHPHIPENYFSGDNPLAPYNAGWVRPGRRFFANFLRLAADEKK